MNLEAMGVSVDIVDKTSLLEAEFKKYVSDIEPSIKYLEKILGKNSKD